MKFPATHDMRSRRRLGVPLLSLIGGCLLVPSTSATAHPESLTACSPVVSSTVNVGNGPFGIAVDPDGQRVYVTNFNDDSVTVIDSSSNSVVAGPIMVGLGPRDIAFKVDGTVAYVANSSSSTVSLIDTSTNTTTGTVTVGNFPYSVAVSPDGAHAYVNSAQQDDVTVIDTVSDTATGSLTVGLFPWAVAASPDGLRAYVANRDNDFISVIDTVSNLVTSIAVGFDFQTGLDVSADNDYVYVSNYFGNSVSVVDVANDVVLPNPIPVGLGPHGIAASPNGRFVIVTNMSDDSISIIDTRTGQVEFTVPVGDMPMEVAVSPDSRRAYVTNNGSDTVSVVTLNCPTRRSPAPLRRVNLDPAGGSCAEHSSVWTLSFRDSLELPTGADCVRDGYVFLGWSADPTRTDPDAPLTTRVTRSGDLTAVWVALPEAPDLLGIVANFLCDASCNSILVLWSTSTVASETVLVSIDGLQVSCASKGQNDGLDWCWINGLESGADHTLDLQLVNVYGAGPKSSGQFTLR